MRGRRRSRGAISALPLLLLGLSCARQDSPRDVLLVTIDTARADRFSYAGESPVATPNIDRVAAEGTAFLQAIAPAPLTLVSHATIHTGLIPPHHGVRNNGTFRLAEEHATLAELLQQRGYETAAFVGAAVLAADYGLDQGFDVYDDGVGEAARESAAYMAERPAADVVSAARRWLTRNADRPTFLWVHVFDPHAPYDPPEPERSRFTRAPYDGEIAACDRLLGTLFDEYRRSGRWRRALVVITADHGESLYEHGEASHGVFVYDSTLKVPLVVRAPGIGEGRRVTEQVGLVDLMRTITGLLDVPPPPLAQGRDLAPLMADSAGTGSVPVYVESLYPQLNFGWAPLTGLRASPWKLIVGAAPELYRTDVDPLEAKNLAELEPEQLRRLSGHLATTVRDARPLSERELSPEERDRLAALGYVWHEHTPEASGADPRRHIVGVRQMGGVIEMFERGFRGAALERCLEIQRNDPGNLWVRGWCARLADPADSGPPSASLPRHGTLPSRGLPSRPPPDGDPESLLRAAEVAVSRDDFDVVRAQLAALARRIVDDNDAVVGVERDTRFRLAERLGRMGSRAWERVRLGEAVQAYRLASLLVPEDPRTHFNLGLAWQRFGEPEQAVSSFERTLALDPDFPRGEENLRAVREFLARIDPR